MQVYTNDDVSPDALKGGRVAVIGYGSQGRAHAQNLRDSGYDVVAGVRKGGKGWTNASADGIATAEPEDAAKGADIIAILTPDMAQADIWRAIEPNIADGAALLFAHGFSIHYGRAAPRATWTSSWSRPRGPAIWCAASSCAAAACRPVRRATRTRPARPRDRAMAYAKGIGGATGGLIETTLRRRNRDRSVRRTGRAVRRRQGIGDGRLPDPGRGRLSARGRLFRVPARAEADRRPASTRAASRRCTTSSPRPPNTARSFPARASSTKRRARACSEVLKDIQSGNFARDWILENQAGKPRYNAMLNADRNHPIETDRRRPARAHGLAEASPTNGLSLNR